VRRISCVESSMQFLPWSSNVDTLRLEPCVGSCGSKLLFFGFFMASNDVHVFVLQDFECP